MASKAQIKANRKNAARSTGPKTESGKATSARNATRHGLSSAGIAILPTEKQEDLDALAKTLTDEHHPEGDTETFLVHQMIQARWKLARIERLESEAFDAMLEDEGAPMDSDRRLLTTLSGNGNIFDKLQRHSATAERSYYKALRELQNLRAVTKKNKMQNEAESAQAVLRDLLASSPIGVEDWPYQDETLVSSAMQNEAKMPTAVLRR